MKACPNRIEKGFALLTAELYHNLRALPVRGSLDSAALFFGPELRRHPWLKSYFTPAMVHDIESAMHGREAVYSQMRDLQYFLYRQAHPLTLQEQQAMSLDIEQWLGLSLPLEAFKLMTKRSSPDAPLGCPPRAQDGVFSTYH